MCFEKPFGLYNETLYLSAKLQLPTAEQPRALLVEGLVQRAVPLEEDPGQVEVRAAGTFRAHEQIDGPGDGAAAGSADDLWSSYAS